MSVVEQNKVRDFLIFYTHIKRLILLRKSYEWLKVTGLVIGAFALWRYYKYHERKINSNVEDDEEKYRRSNILNTVNDVIVPWFTIINDLKVKYPVSELKYKVNNLTLSFSKFEIIEIIQKTHNVKLVLFFAKFDFLIFIKSKL